MSLYLTSQAGWIGHAEMPLQFKGRDVVLGLGQQMHRQKPARQRNLGGLEYGAGDYRRLVPASAALPVFPLAAEKHTGLIVATFRTIEAFCPTRFLQRCLAQQLSTIPTHELRHRQARLKLNIILRHDLSPRMRSSRLTEKYLKPQAQHMSLAEHSC